MTTGRYGLPLDVRFCTKCTVSNQRPGSTIEFRSDRNTPKVAIHFDEEGVCDACRYADEKRRIDWDARHLQLKDVCDRYRRNDGRYDVIVPGSGGKDSIMTAHLLKYHYGMHPLTVTWPPHLYTDAGWRNFQAWLQAGFANYTYWPNQKVHRLVSRLAFLNLVHPFQPFIIGQRNIAPRMAIQMDIPFIMYGENQAEYGNRRKENDRPVMNEAFFSTRPDLNEVYLGGVPASEIIREYRFDENDLEAYLPTDPDLLRKTKVEVHYMGYYHCWHPQEVYYYAAENTGFLPNDERTEGSYSTYSSFDDKIDWLHYYTTYIKFGIGRATYDSCQEIRNGDITRDEGVHLVQRFDGEFPKVYLPEILRYLDIDLETFMATIDSARPDHLWRKRPDGDWDLIHRIWEQRSTRQE